MYPSGRKSIRKGFINTGRSSSLSQTDYYSESYESESYKESHRIYHTAIPDKKRAMFSVPLKNPYWPENLWKDETLVYSYKQPEKCLGPPSYRNDRTIRFNSRFESGNLMYAYRLNPDVYHCILEYDHSSAGQCQWFYFQMSNIKIIPNSNRKMTFYITGFNKPSGVFASGSKVFMYSEKLAQEKNIGWFRTGTNYAYGVATRRSSNDGKQNISITDTENDKENNKRKKGKNKHGKLKRSTLQFQITFPYDDDVVYFCYAQPYTFSDLNTYISQWVQQFPTLIKRTKLCITNGEKECPLLTITAPNTSYSIRKKCIFLTARIHPGESNGSIVLHGLIEYLLSKQPLTEYLLDHFVFKIVPMINIDGVVEGYYRVGLEGEDLNRVWSNPDRSKHPVVFHTKSLMHEMNKKMGVIAYIDFHGHSREHGTFAYGCPWDESENLPPSMINKEKIFPKILANLCESFSFEKCVFSIPQKRKDASRCVVRRELGVVNSFTIESSFGGLLNEIWSNTLYNDFSWKEIGQKVGESLYHLLAEPATQVLKTAEKEIAESFPIKPRQKTQEEAPKDVPKVVQNDQIEENAVVAIDTKDGIKVISANNKSSKPATARLPSSSRSKPSTNSKPKPKEKTNTEKNDAINQFETVYTLKMSDLYSSSSSSSISNIKTNPRINMNKNTYLNSKSNANAASNTAQNDNKQTNQTQNDNESSNSTTNINKPSNQTQNDNKSSNSTTNINKSSNQTQNDIGSSYSTQHDYRSLDSSSSINEPSNSLKNNNKPSGSITSISKPSNPQKENKTSNINEPPDSTQNENRPYVPPINIGKQQNQKQNGTKSPNPTINNKKTTETKQNDKKPLNAPISNSKQQNQPQNNSKPSNATSTNSNNKPLESTPSDNKLLSPPLSNIRSQNSSPNVIKIIVTNTKTKTKTKSSRMASSRSNSHSNRVSNSNSNAIKNSCSISNVNKISFSNSNSNSNIEKVPISNADAENASNLNSNEIKTSNSNSNKAFSHNSNNDKVPNPNSYENKISNSNSSPKISQNSNENEDSIKDSNLTKNQIPKLSSNENKLTNPNPKANVVSKISSNDNKTTSSNSNSNNEKNNDQSLYPLKKSNVDNDFNSSPASVVELNRNEEPKSIDCNVQPKPPLEQPNRIESKSIPFVYEDSSTRSYISSQTDSNPFSALDADETVNSNSNSGSGLLFCSSATFNSSSTFGKPPKNTGKLKPKIKTPIQKPKNLNNSRSPKMKSNKI